MEVTFVLVHGMLIPAVLSESDCGDDGCVSITNVTGGRILAPSGWGGLAFGLGCMPLGHNLVPYSEQSTATNHLRWACLALDGILEQAMWLLALFLQFWKQFLHVCQCAHMTVLLSLAHWSSFFPANCSHFLLVLVWSLRTVVHLWQHFPPSTSCTSPSSCCSSFSLWSSCCWCCCCWSLFPWCLLPWTMAGGLQ